MYSRISIKNFRGIESLDASGFRRINVIVGRNNSGKTTFLESLLLLGGATNPQFATTLGPFARPAIRKGYPRIRCGGRCSTTLIPVFPSRSRDIGRKERS